MDTRTFLKSCLEKVVEQKGQDMFLKAGVEPRMRLGPKVTPLPFNPVSREEIQSLVHDLLTPQQLEALQTNKSVDFGFTFQEKDSRFRGNAFYQQGALSVVFRLLWRGIPDFDQLRLPSILKKVALEKSGIILVAGAVSSGKSTTIAAMINSMNESVQRHIIMLEDPVEYIHPDKQCLIQQREVGEDMESFGNALKYVVRQSPDVAVIGEMRDAESFSFALSAAEVGRLVISSIHAQSVPQVFDRILGFFRREGERDTILRHFAANMSCIMVQKLLIATDGQSLVPATEILLGNYTTRQLILDKKIDKLPQAIRNAHEEGMQTMDQSIFERWKAGLITQETALSASHSPEDLQSLMKGIRIGQDTKILGQ